MATNIYNYDGTLRTTVADGAIDTTTTIKFPGRGYLNYGESVNENMLWLMQNFSSASAPPTPVTGQAWYDTMNDLLKIWTGSAWIAAGGVVQSPVNPGPGSNPGALWFDTTNLQLYIWAGSAWLLVGPLGSAVNQDPVSPVVPSHSIIQSVRLSDGANLHQVWRINVGATLLAIFSTDAEFTPSPSIAGFVTIKPGLNLNTSISDVGITDNTTFKSNQDNLPMMDNTYNMGSVSNRFASMYASNFNGVASSALYADVAERYFSDEELEAATVVCLGGAAEVEACRVNGSDQVFGVVSTEPAYLMNSEAGPDRTHPAIALTGRVPCKVIGQVFKGDMMVSAGYGYAKPNNTPAVGTVIGKALADFTGAKGQIEIVVGRV